MAIRKINIDDNEISVILGLHEEDYICLTDMVKAGENSERTNIVIQNWMRRKDTISYLGVWENLHNPDFNGIEFDAIRNASGTNRFVLTAKEWCGRTHARGIVSKTGRYGGTYAHKDIAYHFGMWLSPEFYTMIGNKRYVRYNHGAWVLEYVYNSEGYIKYWGEEEHYPYYYIKDHLGSVRETYIHPAANLKYCEQRMQYYPSGLPWNTNLSPSYQPFKYGSKEFVEMHGLDEYDSDARWYYPAIMRTTSMDPKCEDYYPISPYAWCGNNPVNYVDPDGNIIKISGDSIELAISQIQDKVADELIIGLDKSGQINYKIKAEASLSSYASLLINIIDDPNIEINVTSHLTNTTSNGRFFVGGAFMGNTIIKGEDGCLFVHAFQEINPLVLQRMDNISEESGKNIFHEISESYFGAQISKSINVDAVPGGDIYQLAHQLATPQTPLYRVNFDRFGHITFSIKDVATSITYGKNKSNIPVRVVTLGLP